MFSYFLSSNIGTFYVIVVKRCGKYMFGLNVWSEFTLRTNLGIIVFTFAAVHVVPLPSTDDSKGIPEEPN